LMTAMRSARNASASASVTLPVAWLRAISVRSGEDLSCAARELDSGLRVASFNRSGGSRVLIDQAVEDRFSADAVGVEVRRGAVDITRIPVGGALVDALMRAGGVVVLLILG
jgi:hypothetical protein